MELKEFAGYAAGTAFVALVAAALVGGLVLLIGSVPLLLALFPLSAGVLGTLCLIGYLRHRRQRRGRRG